MEQEKLKCEVCNQEDSFGVASVPGIPYSAAYGLNCLNQGADPWDIVRANIVACGGPANVASWVLGGRTFVADKYMTVREALEVQPITEQELQELDSGIANLEQLEASPGTGNITEEGWEELTI